MISPSSSPLKRKMSTTTSTAAPTTTNSSLGISSSPSSSSEAYSYEKQQKKRMIHHDTRTFARESDSIEHECEGVPLENFLNERIDEKLNRFEKTLRELSVFYREGTENDIDDEKSCHHHDINRNNNTASTMQHAIINHNTNILNEDKQLEEGLEIEISHRKAITTRFKFLNAHDMLRVAGMRGVEDLFCGGDYEDVSNHIRPTIDFELLDVLLKISIAQHNAKNGVSVISIFQIAYQLTQIMFAERKAALKFMSENMSASDDKIASESSNVNVEELIICQINRIRVMEYNPEKGEEIKIALTYNEYQREHSYRVWNDQRESCEIFALGKLLFSLLAWHYLDFENFTHQELFETISQNYVHTENLCEIMAAVMRKLYHSQTMEHRKQLLDDLITEWPAGKFTTIMQNSYNTSTYMKSGSFNAGVLDWLFEQSKKQYYKQHVTTRFFNLFSDLTENGTHSDEDSTNPFINSSSVFDFFSSHWEDLGTVNHDAILRDCIFSKKKIESILQKISSIGNPIIQKRYIKKVLVEILPKSLQLALHPQIENEFNIQQSSALTNYLFPNVTFFQKYAPLTRALSCLLFPIPELRIKLDTWQFVELPQFISSVSQSMAIHNKEEMIRYLDMNPFFQGEPLVAESNTQQPEQLNQFQKEDEHSPENSDEAQQQSHIRQNTFMSAIAFYGLSDFKSSITILNRVIESRLRQLNDILNQNHDMSTIDRGSMDTSPTLLSYDSLMEKQAISLDLLLTELILSYSYKAKGQTETKMYDDAKICSIHSIKVIHIAHILLSKSSHRFEEARKLMKEILETHYDTIEAGVQLYAVVETCVKQWNNTTPSSTKEEMAISNHKTLEGYFVLPRWLISTFFTIAYIYDHIDSFEEAIRLYKFVIMVCPTYSMAFNNCGICLYRLGAPNLDQEPNIDQAISAQCEEESFANFTLSSNLDKANICPHVNRVSLLVAQSSFNSVSRIKKNLLSIAEVYETIGYEGATTLLKRLFKEDTTLEATYLLWIRDRRERAIFDSNCCILCKTSVEGLEDVAEYLFDRSLNFQSLSMFDQAVIDLSRCFELSVLLSHKADTLGGYQGASVFQSSVLFNRALCYDFQQRPAEALEDLYKILEIDPNDADALSMIDEMLHNHNAKLRLD
ncbi:hypothetical protein C9374_004763 [Naegleria lovaniensis]|uniref:Uncharacterized protein n=1 Tax=Naegleria lovaniensis TaxID=51637 RepID=A0AA88GPA6_NAELO|nr:uncharacterized protein C9374_004763 [Naegleria lovaniensis]KAG2382796.1 hypothetical protein C9374_004763 [Naegleria lovaniensis]